VPGNINPLPSWLIPPASWIAPPKSAPSADPTGKAAIAPKPVGKREPVKWRPMTALEQRAAAGLGHCRLPPGTSTKRLARHLAEQAQRPEPVITDKQSVFLWQFCYTFRRQIYDRAVTREAHRQKTQKAMGG
jgi:hypothetical protein